MSHGEPETNDPVVWRAPRYVRPAPRPVHRPKRVSSTSRVYDAIRSGIRNGTYLPESVISEDVLVRTLNVTRASVREALGMLTAEGVVSRSPRKGTSPIQSTVHVAAHDVLSFDRSGTELSDRIKEVPKSRQVYLADPVIGAKLGLAATDRVRIDESIITVDAEPVGLRSIYSPIGILLGDGSQVHGIHLLVKLESLGITVAQVDSTFEAISADRTTALSLGVPEGAPILLREMIHYTSAGIPVCLSTIRHRSDRVIVHTSRLVQAGLAPVN